MRRLNGHLLVALMVTLALVLAACSPARTPVPTQSPTPTSVAAPTPTPEPPSHTVTEAIGWLRDAGLQVEAVEGAGPGVSNPDRQVQLDGSPVRVSVDGYDRVWIYAFAPPMGREAIFRYFDMNASFTREGHPTVFNVENVTVLVRGDDTDVLEKVLVSLWDRTPIHYLTPFGIWPLAPSSGDADRARWLTWVRELAARWLQSPQRGERAVSLVADAEVRLVRLGDYLARFPASDGPYPRLPHPATLVWAVATSSEAGHAVVLLDAWNYIVVGAAYTSERLPLEEVPEVPIPGPVELTPTDGVWSEHDELAAILSWLEPAVARIIPDVWHERVETYVLERAPVRFGPWKTLAVVSRKGYNGPHAGTVYLITPPEGRAIISGRMDAATIKYWDWDVKQGVQYSYRVYGCTYLGRRTPYSDVAQAVAGDPLPETPHPYDARPGSTPVEPPC
ncbi:MAG: hypothetical protein Q8N53_15455 [Longimicrobiales bacterium]|nr:hypothetical protein [Longimicrobiales bacterium]